MIVKDGPDELAHHAVAMKASGRLKSGASVTRANHLANAGYGFV
jgi:hypothetical protein